MTRSSMLPLALAASAASFASGAARADAPPPPARPTMFLVLHAGSLAGKAALIGAAVRAALPAVPRGFAVVVVGSEGSGAAASAAFAPTQPKLILDEVKRLGAGSTSADSALMRAASEWSHFGTSAPRHHAVLVSGAALAARDLRSGSYFAARKGFTVSVLALARLDPKEQKELERQGAGRAKSLTARTLAVALRAELAWGKLTKAQEQAQSAAAKDNRLGLLKVLGATGGGGGVVGGVVGGGGLRGVGPRSYSSKLRRGESLIGKKLALGFRQVSCGASCDVAEVRRQLLAAAGPLLKCLEGALTVSADDVSLELTAAGKVAGAGGAAASCAQAWLAGRPRGVAATLVVGAASAVQ